jgi:hypothetical protein
MTLNLKLTFALCMALVAANALAQNGSTQMQAFSSSGVSVNSVNGQTVVTWNGKQVFSGPAKGYVSARSINMNGTPYAAAFDGDTVIWENVPGAAEQLRSGQGRPAGFDPRKLMESFQKRTTEQEKPIEQQQNLNGQTNSQGVFSGSSISVKTVNGETVAVYQGKEIPIGQTKGLVFAKAKSVNGVSYAVVFDGDQVVWENVPGAAEQFK